MTQTPFDPWDWLGVHCGGFDRYVDNDIITILQCLKEGIEPSAVDHGISDAFVSLVSTFLCNTDAFEFDDNPTQLRFVGDERFQTLDQLIDAWDQWYGSHYR